MILFVLTMAVVLILGVVVLCFALRGANSSHQAALVVIAWLYAFGALFIAALQAGLAARGILK